MSKQKHTKDITYNDNEIPEISLETLGSMALVRLGMLSIDEGIEIKMSTVIKADGKNYRINLVVDHQKA